MDNLPPPVLSSAKLLAYARSDSDVEFTDRLNMYVGDADGLERLGEVSNFAICQEYGSKKEVLLLFCGEDWEQKAVSGRLASVSEAKRRAEVGYVGLLGKWRPSPYSIEHEREYLRAEYQVDPDTAWWTHTCSFCGQRDAAIESERASICRQCIVALYEGLEDGADA